LIPHPPAPLSNHGEGAKGTAASVTDSQGFTARRNLPGSETLTNSMPPGPASCLPATPCHPEVHYKGEPLFHTKDDIRLNKTRMSLGTALDKACREGAVKDLHPPYEKQTAKKVNFTP